VSVSPIQAAPLTALETQLAEIWKSLLPVESVAADDDFFAIGGHSLLATRMIARIADRLGLELPLISVFEVADTARAGRACGGGTATQAGRTGCDSAPRTAGRSMSAAHYVFPASFAQQRLWFLDQLEGASAVYNLKMALRLSGPLDQACLQRAVDAVVARHESLRTSFAMRGTDVVQRVASQLDVPVQSLALDGASDAVLAAKLNELGAASFDLQHGPAVARASAAYGCDVARAAAGHAPHRLGCVVSRHPVSRPGGVLQCFQHRCGRAAARTAGAVRRLRSLAA
jgi:hypothetical protein